MQANFEYNEWSLLSANRQAVDEIQKDGTVMRLPVCGRGLHWVAISHLIAVVLAWRTLERDVSVAQGAR